MCDGEKQQHCQHPVMHLAPWKLADSTVKRCLQAGEDPQSLPAQEKRHAGHALQTARQALNFCQSFDMGHSRSRGIGLKAYLARPSWLQQTPPAQAIARPQRIALDSESTLVSCMLSDWVCVSASSKCPCRRATLACIRRTSSSWILCNAEYLLSRWGRCDKCGDKYCDACAGSFVRTHSHA